MNFKASLPVSRGTAGSLMGAVLNLHVGLQSVPTYGDANIRCWITLMSPTLESVSVFTVIVGATDQPGLQWREKPPPVPGIGPGAGGD